MHHNKNPKITIMNISKSKDGIYYAQRDQENLICPFIAPTVQQNSIGQQQIVYPNCSSLCVHFNMVKLDGNKADLSLTCGSTYTNIVEIIEEKVKDTILFPIK